MLCCHRVAKDHTVASGFCHIFEHQIIKMLQYILVIFLIKWKIGWRIGKNRLFIQIIPDHLRNKIIDSLIICHTIARCIQKCHISFSEDIINMRNSDQRLRFEIHRIQVVIRNTPIHGTNPFQFSCRCDEIQLVIFYGQLRTVDQMRSDLLCQITVLKIRRIISSRCQYHGMSAHIDIVQCSSQQLRIISIVLNLEIRKCLRRGAPA